MIGPKVISKRLQPHSCILVIPHPFVIHLTLFCSVFLLRSVLAWRFSVLIVTTGLLSKMDYPATRDAHQFTRKMNARICQAKKAGLEWFGRVLKRIIHCLSKRVSLSLVPVQACIGSKLPVLSPEGLSPVFFRKLII